jgi:hypothetical protein
LELRGQLGPGGRQIERDDVITREGLKDSMDGGEIVTHYDLKHLRLYSFVIARHLWTNIYHRFHKSCCLNLILTS